ncbi:MAG TPA: ferredoxin reductase [Gaiellaceae bacterium]|nr:ferredoxin reductase [Gaiellaceae bacterium]
MVELFAETPRTKSIAFELDRWPGHRAGQHVDVRLTAEDGYQAQRSYSIASAPEDELVVLTVERLDDGEVSPYLVDEMRPGDTLELRGPVGGYFVWESDRGGPLLLVAGGSGVAPLHSILRHHQAIGSSVPVRLLYSARSLADVIYLPELRRAAAEGAVDVRYTLTRERPEGWQGYGRRIDEEILADVAWSPGERPLVYVCGPSAFVETAANALVDLGHEPGRILTERFGATGG